MVVDGKNIHFQLFLKRNYSNLFEVMQSIPEFREGKDTKGPSFHLQKHGWSIVIMKCQDAEW